MADVILLIIGWLIIGLFIIVLIIWLLIARWVIIGCLSCDGLFFTIDFQVVNGNILYQFADNWEVACSLCMAELIEALCR